jgi:hypothetical protein
MTHGRVMCSSAHSSAKNATTSGVDASAIISSA